MTRYELWNLAYNKHSKSAITKSVNELKEALELYLELIRSYPNTTEARNANDQVNKIITRFHDMHKFVEMTLNNYNPKCYKCKKVLHNVLTLDNRSYCPECYEITVNERVIITTAHNIEGYRIVKYIGI